MSPGGKGSRALLVALPLVLPFEAPLFSVGPLVVTTAELAIYALLAVWGVERAMAGRAGAAAAFGLGAGDRLGRAVALWLGVVVLSALLAPARPAIARSTPQTASSA